jgi:hypothetical protein
LDSFPTSRYEFTSIDVDIAANLLGWSTNPNITAPVDETLDQNDLVRIAFKPIRQKREKLQNVAIRFHYGSEWSQGSTVKDEKSEKIVDYASLPEGLRELLTQIELAYSPESAGRLSREEIVDSVASSSYLVIIFPHVTRFIIRCIRESYRDGDVSNFLKLISAMIANQSYTASSEFSILLNCLLDLIMDFDARHELRTRKHAMDILMSLLHEKLGPFHAKKLVVSLIRDIFTPWIWKVVKLNKNHEHVEIGFTAATIAYKRLVDTFELEPIQASLKRDIGKFSKQLSPSCLAEIQEALR